MNTETIKSSPSIGYKYTLEEAQQSRVAVLVTKTEAYTLLKKIRPGAEVPEHVFQMYSKPAINTLNGRFHEAEYYLEHGFRILNFHDLVL